MYSNPNRQPQVAHQTRNASDHAITTSLRERLDALSAHEDEVEAEDEVEVEEQNKQLRQQKYDQQPPASFKTPKEAQFLDVTAAFFSGPMSHVKGQSKNKVTTPETPLARVQTQPPWRSREQQQRQPPPTQKRNQPGKTPSSGFNVSESPDAQALIQAVAAQSNHLYDNGVNKLGELDKSLREIRAEITSEDDQLLNKVKESIRRYRKPLSETKVLDDCIDELGVVNRKSVHVGQRFELVKNRINTLEAEVNSLWDQWEDAQRQVDLVLAELVKRDGEGTSNESGSTAAVRASLARETVTFEKELEDILDDAHEEARAFEKDFSKRIHAVQHTFLQGYLLQD